MAAVERGAWEEYMWHDDSPSGFLKLPAEIRNIIYCLTLVTGTVVVEDMHPDDWQAEEKAGHPTRISYRSEDYEHYLNYDSNGTEAWKSGKVSYVLQKGLNSASSTIGMLALNRQTRVEAVPIFYGKNTIYFYSVSAVLPFLKDRSEFSLQSMKSFHLDMQIEYHSHRLECWTRVFENLPEVGRLHLEKLTVWMNDPDWYYALERKLDVKMERCVHEMAKTITNLDMLGVTFDFLGLEYSLFNGRAEELQELLWEFLAPKMLKKVENEPHDAHSLLKRRIYDVGG